jgi:hypothetical protein
MTKCSLNLFRGPSLFFKAARYFAGSSSRTASQHKSTEPSDITNDKIGTQDEPVYHGLGHSYRT